MPRPTTPLAERFHAKHTTGSGCWIWTASKDRNGYPLFLINERRGTTGARMSYTLAYGPIPLRKLVTTSCGNRDCVRPDHLKLVTLSEAKSRSRIHLA